MARRRSGNQLAFNDMLFNVLLGFVVLFVIAFLLINPITKKQDIPSKAEAMILIEWDNTSAVDVDLWLGHDSDPPVGFSNKAGMGMNLERDDLGTSNDRMVIDGEVSFIKINREVINIRGIVPGLYYPNVHVYSWSRSQVEPLKVTVTVIDINPRYKEVYTVEFLVTSKGEVVRTPGFEIDKEGRVGKVFNHTRTVVPHKPSTQ
jgi:hypothetical protein|tara:strand:- start:123 stop:734 length:612 start_codon:yes stop_codon:yes gene_type:complete